MSQDHNDDEEMRIFSIDDQDGSDTEPLDLEGDAYDVFNASLPPDFDEALAAIQEDTIEPRMLAGFSDMSRNDVRKLNTIWRTLPDDTRITIADHILALGQDDLLLDYQRFYRLLVDDSAAAVRQAGASGLAMYEDEDLIDPLVRMVTSDPDDGVRVVAAEALATFTTLGEFLELTDKMVKKLRTVLMGIINDTTASGPLRAAALAAAAVRSEDEEIQNAVEAFYHSGDAELRMGAIQAMGRSGNSRWLPLLDSAVRSTDSDVRQLVARSLAPFEAEVVPLLTMLVREDPEGPVRLEAIQSLGIVGGRKALESLQTLRDYVSDDEIEAIDIAMSEAEAWIQAESLGPDADFAIEEDDLF